MFEEVNVRIHDSVIRGWEFLAEDEAIDAAIDKCGKDPTTSVAFVRSRRSTIEVDPSIGFGAICF